MRSSVTDLKTTLEREPEQLGDVLADVHPEDVAQALQDEQLGAQQVSDVLGQLPIEQAAEVLERLPDELRVNVLQLMQPEDSAEMLTEMSADDRADLVTELPKSLRESILSELRKTEPGVADDVNLLSSYDRDTAGGIMTTEYLALGPGMSCEKAISEVRRMAREQRPELVNSLYVVESGKLVGVLSLRELILGEPTAPIAIYMTENLVTVLPGVNKKEVAHTIADYDISALPVVDEERQLLGVITVDDVMDVVIEAADEDAQKMAALVPVDKSYFDISFFTFVKSRITWLVALFVGELLTSTVMRHYEAQIAALMDLVIFVPLILSSGGNSGSQSSSLVIRALALGEVKPSDWLKVFWRELAVGVALGVLLALVGFLRTYALGRVAHPLTMGLVVASSIVAVVTLGSMVGALMPLLIKRVGLDPAVSSTPFVASLVDVFGLVVYFSVARLVLTIM